MPYRSISVWVVVLGVVGLAMAGVLVVWGVDLRRAAATGPRWKRAPIAAALLLLGLAGAAGTNTACIACYAPPPIGFSMKRGDFLKELESLNRQLPLLEKYAAQQTIDAEVVRKLLASAEREVWILETEYARERLQPEESARARALCQQARVSLKALRRRVGYDEQMTNYFEWNRQLWEQHRQEEEQQFRKAHPTSQP